MIGLMESSKERKPAENAVPMEDAAKKCATLNNFFKPIQTSPSGPRMVGDLRSYFSTSPPSSKTQKIDVKCETSKSIQVKSSEKSTKTLKNDESEPGKNKNKDCHQVKPKIMKDTKKDKNEVHLNGKQSRENDDRKSSVAKSKQQLKKSKTGVNGTKVKSAITKTKDETVNDVDGDEVHLNGKQSRENDDRKSSVAKCEQQLKKSKTGVNGTKVKSAITKTKDKTVNDVDGDVNDTAETDVANCSFVSFEDFLGEGETELENSARKSVNQKERKQQKRNKNESTIDGKSSGDKKVKNIIDEKNSKPVRTHQEALTKENQILPGVKKCKTVVAEIHSPVSSPEHDGDSKNNSPQRNNPRRRSNVVVDSGMLNLSEIEVVQSDFQNNNQLPLFHIESKSNSTKSFPIFQKNTQQEAMEVKGPVFSIFEKKSKDIEKDVDKTSKIKKEVVRKRKINTIEKEKMQSNEQDSRKKRKKVNITAANSSTRSVDDFVVDTVGKGSIKKGRKKQEKQSEETSQKLRRSTRRAPITSSTPNKNFEVESAIQADGTIRMKIKVKKNAASQVKAKCDVKTVTASKLLKKAKGQSAKVMKASKKSCRSVAMKLKQSPSASNQMPRKRTNKQTATNQDKNAKPQKVASIFTKGGRKNASGAMKIKAKSKPGVCPDQKIIPSKHCPDEKQLPVLDEETLKARRAFLNKEVHHDVHKQTDNTINVNDLKEPPLPSIRHILQKDTNPLWELPKVNLNLKIMDDVKQTSNQQKLIWNFNQIDKKIHHKYMIKDFAGHPEFSYETQRILLNRLSLEYPKFPVRRIYKRYLAKYRGDNENSKKEGSKRKSDGKATKEINKQESKPGKRKSALPADNEDRKKRRKIPENEGKSIKNETATKKTEVDEQVRPVRRTRRKKNVITDDDVETEDCKKTKAKQDALSTEKEAAIYSAKPVGLLWTEKYQPTNVLELIGNQGNMKKLQSWLTEWKKLAIREKRKIKKEIKKKSTSQGAKDWWIQDDDSDFDFIDDFDSDDDDDSDDYDDYENSLCNTKILVGPSGIGKTAAVYACANELGFKVFEVNASNRRTGKQILSELGEATQSHHVARQSVSGPLASFLSVQSSPKKLANPVKPKAGIQNYFKPAGSLAQTKKQLKTCAAKAAKMSPAVKEEEQVLSVKKITSTSLIFFKDVDIVFGEDKGFVAAVNNFMETTKKPIIMTTSDSTICDDFSSDSETLQFRSPSVDQLAVNLQLICLAENVLTNRDDLIRLANLFDCDARRCITALQYWVESGAGISPCAVRSSRTDQGLTDESVNTQQPDTDITAVKYIATSNNADTNICKMASSMDSDTPMQVMQHSRCFESTIGLLNMQNNLDEMFTSLKHPNESASNFSKQCELVALFNQIGISILQNNLHTLLPRIQFKEKKRLSSNKIDDPHSRQSTKVIDTFAALADDMSFMDAACCSLTGSQQKSTSDLLGQYQSSKVTTGLSDLSDMRGNDWQSQSCMSDVIAAIQVASFQQCRKNIGEVERELVLCGSDDPSCHLLEDGHQDSFRIHYETEIQRRSIIASDVMYTSVASRLPVQVFTNQRSLGLDYYPSLRNICQNEKLRKEAQLKRRYLHYLDSISVVLKENTRVLLATSLQASQQGQCTK